MIDLSYYPLPMAMGKRKRNRQPRMWVATTDCPTAASHPFYTRLNQLLREHGFDDFAEAQCTLEANAALRSIVRRGSGESYEEFLTKLAKASGIGTPTRADLARTDRKRKKKGSNDHWTHPHDPDAKITKMKDGRTHLAHKAEHAIDLDTGAIMGVTVQGADEGDTTTVQETPPEAAEQLEAVAAVADDPVAVIEEVGRQALSQPANRSRSQDAGDHVHQRTRSRTTIVDRPTAGTRRGLCRPPGPCGGDDPAPHLVDVH